MVATTQAKYSYNYPLLCIQEHNTKYRVINLLEEGEEGVKTFEIPDVSFVCFLEHSNAQAETRIMFLGVMPLGNMCIVLFRCQDAYKKQRADILESWTVEKIVIHTGFKHILQKRSEIRTAFWLGGSHDEQLRKQT